MVCAELGYAQTRAAVNVDAVPRLEARQDRRLGDRDDPDVGFSRISSAAVDRTGQLYVFESVELRIRVYDANGRELRRFGGRGAGPGEFRGPTTIGVVGDTIWAVDPAGNRRLTLFSREGRVLHTAPAAVPSVPVSSRYRATLTPTYMSSAGLLVSEVTSIYTDPREPDFRIATDTVLIPRLRFDLQARVVDTAGWVPRYAWEQRFPTQPRTIEVVHVNGERYRRPVPPLDKRLVAPFAEGHFLVDRQTATNARRGSFRVTRVALGGKTVFSRDFVYRPVLYNGVVLDSIAAYYSYRRATADGTNAVIRPPGADSIQVRKALRAAIDFPRFPPPVQDHWVAHDGALWLRREDTGGGSFDWLVIEPDGNPRGVVRLKRRLRLLWSSGDTLWAIEPDEVDVPWLVRYRIARRG
jgi:hypothetical protein